MPMLVPQTDAATGGGTDGGRRPPVVPPPVAASPELSDRPRRRTFTAKDKLRILAEADRAAATGGIGAILRREGLYSSALTSWRRQRDAGAIGGLSPATRGPKTAEPNPLATELTRLQQDHARLTQRLTRAEAIIDIQKKLLRCWASRWPPATTSPDGRSRGTRTSQRHDESSLRRARDFARQRAAPARASGPTTCGSSPPAETRAGADRPATAGGAGLVACAALRRSGPG